MLSAKFHLWQPKKKRFKTVADGTGERTGESERKMARKSKVKKCTRAKMRASINNARRSNQEGWGASYMCVISVELPINKMLGVGEGAGVRPIKKWI